MKTKIKDIILIVGILIIAISGFFMFSNVFKNTKSNMAIIIQNNEIVAKVDFINQEVEILITDGNYPIVNEELSTITLLGNSQGGQRYEFVIKYDFTKHSMQVIEEVSPKHYSSLIGEQTKQPIPSIPNGIRIVFSDDGEVNVDDSL